MFTRHLHAVLILMLATAGVGCTAPHGDAEPSAAGQVKDSGGKADASAHAVFLIASYDGEFITDAGYDLDKQIETHLLYTVGQLNGEDSVGRIDQAKVTGVQTERDGDRVHVRYHAELPVAWNKDNPSLQEYTFILPRDLSRDGAQRFTDAYGESCVDRYAHDVTPGIIWYYYRPKALGCRLDPADVHEVVADLSPSATQTVGKFPEYHKVWEDQVLRVVLVVGKDKEGATSSSDAGIRDYDRGIRLLSDRLRAFDLESSPASIPPSPGAQMPDITLAATLPDGRRVEIVNLLVDGVRNASSEFYSRYEELSSTADLIIYSGHSGLGANIRALASRGSWQRGQYVMVFMNGCDTYAYIDSSLADAHAAVNPDDPEGTKYLDIITNAMPALTIHGAAAAEALVDALLSYERPRTYEQILGKIHESQVVLVSGEHDNVFVPGYGESTSGGLDVVDAAGPWSGLQESGYLERGDSVALTTPVLAPGSYVFELSGDGDADLYLRIGTAPTTSLYDCRPYRAGSEERCELQLNSAAPVHIKIDAAVRSDVTLVGRAL